MLVQKYGPKLRRRKKSLRKNEKKKKKYYLATTINKQTNSTAGIKMSTNMLHLAFCFSGNSVVNCGALWFSLIHCCAIK